MNTYEWGGGGPNILKPLFPQLLLARFCHNYNYLSNQRIALTPPPASEFLLKPSLRQVHGKAREAQRTRHRQPLGGGRDVGGGLPAALQRPASSLRVAAVASAGFRERRAKPGAGQEARRVAWCRGAGRSGSPALAPRPPRAAGVRGGRSAPSAPARSRSRGMPAPGGALAASRAGRRSCPNSRSRSARLRRSRTAAAAPAVGCGAELQPRAARTWEPAPGPGAWRRGAGRGGPAPGGAGPGGAEAPARVRGAPPLGSPVPSSSDGAGCDLPEEEKA